MVTVSPVSLATMILVTRGRVMLGVVQFDHVAIIYP